MEAQDHRQQFEGAQPPRKRRSKIVGAGAVHVLEGRKRSLGLTIRDKSARLYGLLKVLTP